MLLHGFQQGALHFCGGTVDFIGQDEIGEDGAFVHLEALLFLGVDKGADYIRRQQVRGELDAAELRAYGLGQGVDGQSFGQARDAFQQDVPAAEQADEQVVDQMLLAHDDLAHFQGEDVHELALFLDSFV